MSFLERPFEVTVEPRGRTSLVRLAGEFDVSCQKQFEASLVEATFAKPDEIIIDLREVSFIDSTGLKLIIGAWNASRKDGFDLALISGDGQLSQVLKQTGLDQALPLIEGVPSPEYKGARSGSGNGNLSTGADL